MVESLAAVSAFGPMPKLDAPEGASTPGFACHERGDVALVTVIARRGRDAELAAKVVAAFGVNLPTTPLRMAAGLMAFIWAGPGRWLAACEGEAGHRLEASLREALEGVAAVSDQSDGRVILRIFGAHARDVLTKGLPVDMHPSVMQPGAVVMSVIGHIGVHLWQNDEAPTYDCAVSRSYASAFLHWVDEASAEYRAELTP